MIKGSLYPVFSYCFSLDACIEAGTFNIFGCNDKGRYKAHAG